MAVSIKDVLREVKELSESCGEEATSREAESGRSSHQDAPNGAEGSEVKEAEETSDAEQCGNIRDALTGLKLQTTQEDATDGSASADAELDCVEDIRYCSQEATQAEVGGMSALTTSVS